MNFVLYKQARHSIKIRLHRSLLSTRTLRLPGPEVGSYCTVFDRRCASRALRALGFDLGLEFRILLWFQVLHMILATETRKRDKQRENFSLKARHFFIAGAAFKALATYYAD